MAEEERAALPARLQREEWRQGRDRPGVGDFMHRVRNVGDRPSTEPEEDLLGVVAPVDQECPRFPVPCVSPQHSFGDGFEQRLLRCNRSTLSGYGKPRPRLPAGIVGDLSNPASIDLGVTDVALASCRVDADAETSETGVADVPGGLPWPESRDARLSESCCRHGFPLALSRRCGKIRHGIVPQLQKREK